jgi:hypothetical protein
MRSVAPSVVPRGFSHRSQMMSIGREAPIPLKFRAAKTAAFGARLSLVATDEKGFPTPERERKSGAK